MISYNNFGLYTTHKECWTNFSVINDSRDLSDFLSWAMRKAFDLIKSELRLTDWFWYDGQIHAEMDANEEICHNCDLCITHNGILVFRVYEITNGGEDIQQTEQYVVKMKY